ncbi:helix-turn-helix domain-containing protein [Pseudomonas chengduensis]|nr:helix-turn-helix domain-containing protein [Pseudomonas chengduensis]MDH1211116.1 helix-turn-helix domain-containing protein [Pseudomonas chengduensis]
MPSLGERLRDERERLGMSQQEVADECGVTMRSQRNYEKDERQPDASYLAGLAKTGADVIYVVTGVRSTPDLTGQLPADEQLLLEAYRGMAAPARKALLAELLTGGKKPKAKPQSGEGINVSGSGHRVAGRDFNERKE